MSCRSDGRDNRDRGDCCCLYCQEDTLVGCGNCCKCVPRTICVSFTPNDPSLAVGYGTYTHVGNGVYSGTQFGMTIELEHNPCRWHITSPGLGIDEYIDVTGNLSPGTGSFYETGTGSGQRTTNCNADPLLAQFDGIKSDGTTGILRVESHKKQIIPWITDNANCTREICTGCSCIPYCLCIQYSYRIIDPDIDDPDDPDYYLKTLHVNRKACWDSSVGDYGGWHVDFPEFLCLPALSATIRIAPDPSTGACKLYLDGVGDGKSSTGTGTIPGTGTNVGVSNSQSLLGLNCASAFTGRWEFSYPEGYADVVLYAEDVDCKDCYQWCCQDVPAVLYATVSGYEDCWLSGDPYDEDCPWSVLGDFTIPLERLGCNQVWIGQFIIDKCADGGICTRPADRMLITIEATCVYCTYRDTEGKCVPIPPYTNAMTLYISYMGTPPVLVSTHVGTQIGIPSCDPIYALYESWDTHRKIKFGHPLPTVLITE